MIASINIHLNKWITVAEGTKGGGKILNQWREKHLFTLLFGLGRRGRGGGEGGRRKEEGRRGG